MQVRHYFSISIEKLWVVVRNMDSHFKRIRPELGCTTGERLAAEYRSETEMGNDASELLLHLVAVNGASNLARCIHTGRWMILLRCN